MENGGLLLISDFTLSGLIPFLQPRKATAAPFDQVVPVLVNGDLDCWRSDPEAAFAWTRPQGAVRDFGRLLNGEQVPLEDLLVEVDVFAGHLRAAAARLRHLFVATWTLPPYLRGLGLLNLDPQIGPAHHLIRMNLRLIEAVGSEPKIHVLDAARWVACVGRDGCTPKLWHMGKMAFGPAVLALAAQDLAAALRALEGKGRKMIVLDLDDTLWGGIVGDEGWENLNLGGHQPIGEAYVAFQTALAALRRRGIMLGIVSKNTEKIAMEALEKHPEMVLRQDDFVGWRINWSDKAQNIVELAAEANIGLDAVVFIDDNPAERARVRAALPEVLVPEWPSDKMLYTQALAELDCLDPAALTEEDRGRSAAYVADRKRRAAEQSAQSVEDYLASLELQVAVEPLSAVNLARAAQLLNKTNQMNLTTRRMTADEFRAWNHGQNQVFVFRVSDRFGDHGLTGIASLQSAKATAMVADFIVSCRVMGRGVEQAMLHVLAEQARREGSQFLTATYRPTPRNTPCRQFFERQSGMSPGKADGCVCFTWDLGSPYPLPEHIRLVGEAMASPAA